MANDILGNPEPDPFTERQNAARVGMARVLAAVGDLFITDLDFILKETEKRPDLLASDDECGHCTLCRVKIEGRRQLLLFAKKLDAAHYLEFRELYKKFSDTIKLAQKHD